MGYQERNIWVQVFGTIVALAVYIPWTMAAPHDDGGEWLWRMMWVIGGGVMFTVVANVTLAVVARVTREESTPDERDVRISHASERVGTSFLVIAGIVAIVLCAQAAPTFWIAHTIAAGFAASALVGGIAALIMYRGGMPSVVR